MNADARQQPPRVIIYTRVSSEEQTRPGYNSLDMQEDTARRHIRHLADMNGLPCPEIVVYREEGASGKSLERPALKLVRADIARGGVSAVVVYKLDRLTRSLHNFLDLDAEFQSHGTGVVSVKEQFDTTTPMGRALRSLLLIFAELERETIVQRVMDKHTALMEAGKYVGGTRPYGFTSKKGEGLKPHLEQQAVIREIFQWYAVDGLTTVAIARRLNERKEKPPRGDAWNARTVRRILDNPIFRGVQVYGERVGKWPYEPFLDPALVDAATRRLEASRVVRGRNAPTWEWRGVLSCPCCEWRYTHTASIQTLADGTRRHYPYYICSCRRRRREMGNERCPSPRLTPRDLDRLTAALLRALQASQPAPTEPPAPDTRRRLREIEERRRRARVAFLDSSVAFLSEEQYRSIIADCDREAASLKPPPTLPMDGVTLADAWQGLTTAERNSAIRLLVSRADVYPDRIEAATRPTGWLNWPPLFSVPLSEP